MKLHSLFLGLVLSATLMTACGDHKTDATQTAKPVETTTSPALPATETAAAAYACPMDCEKGKTYAEVGKCPVCKMDLTLKEGTAVTK
jgi:hypothetical protein